MSPLGGELTKPAVIHDLVSTALGEEAADLVVKGVRPVNVYLEKVEPPTCLAVRHGRIAALGPLKKAWIGPHTQVVEAGESYLLPGLIDAHTHLDSIFQLGAFTPYALAHGNTCAVTETAMMAGAWGKAGVDLFLKEAARQKMRLFFLAPPLTPPLPELETSADFSAKEFEELLTSPECLGIGETYWTAVTDHDPRVGRFFSLAQNLNKTQEGHAAGAKGDRLVAYAAAGVTSCHEAITGPEALERLRLGIAVQVREGFVRKEMDEVVPSLRDLPDTRQVMLVTDLAPLDGLAENGAMNPLLQKAVEMGVNPARAVAWCSLNPARYFGLRRLGGLAPGNWADFWLAGDLEKFKAQKVYLAGECVAENGIPFDPDTRLDYPESARRTMQCKRPEAADFSIKAQGPEVRARVSVIVSSTITKEAVHELCVEDGLVKPDPKRDILKMGVYNRHARDAAPALGFVQGWGIKSGALATTLLWDANNLLVLGASDREMALAAGRAHELGGGVVVAKGAEILAEHAMPIAGIISDRPLSRIVLEQKACEQALRSLGCGLIDPLLTVQTLSFTGLPFIRLTDKGLVDIKTGTRLEVLL